MVLLVNDHKSHRLPCIKALHYRVAISSGSKLVLERLSGERT